MDLFAPRHRFPSLRTWLIFHFNIRFLSRRSLYFFKHCVEAFILTLPSFSSYASAFVFAYDTNLIVRNINLEYDVNLIAINATNNVTDLTSFFCLSAFKLIPNFTPTIASFFVFLIPFNSDEDIATSSRLFSCPFFHIVVVIQI